MGLRRTEAIVIGGHNLAEADRIIPFYTREVGVVRAVAQGARRIRSRRSSRISMANCWLGRTQTRVDAPRWSSTSAEPGACSTSSARTW